MATIEQRISRLESVTLNGVIPESAYIAVWPIADDPGEEAARERVQAEVDAARAVGRRVVEVKTVDAS